MVKASTQYKREHKADYGHERITVLYEDQYLMIINKPSGMLTVPYPGSRARTALDAVEQYMRKHGTWAPGHKPFTVHRLDRDTSGVMMFAMTESAQKKIMDTWHQMVTERLYRAVAENPAQGMLPDFGLIDAPLAYNAHNIGFVPKEGDTPSAERPRKNGAEDSVYEKHLQWHNGRAQFKTVTARTHFRVVVRGSTHTLFELSLDTGRKNQIRAHLASKGYPLAGDENYRADTDPFGRLALHARTLEFNHPFTGEHMKFEEPEPDNWQAYVEKGDPKPALPVWKDRTTVKAASGKTGAGRGIQHGNGHIKKPASRKQLAGLDFIARGKLRGK